MEYVVMLLLPLAVGGWVLSFLCALYSIWRLGYHLWYMIQYQDTKSARGLFLRHQRFMLIWLLTLSYVGLINFICLWSLL